jgi:hypothetical protein
MALPMKSKPSTKSQSSSSSSSRSSKSKSHKPSTAPFVPETAARAAEALLRTAEEGVVVAHGMSKKAKKRAIAFLRIPAEAIRIAIDVAERHVGRFPDFEVDAAKSAIAYQQAMAPLVQQCRDMASRIEENIFATQADAAEQTLALYGSMKSLSRLNNKGESLLPQIRELSLLVRTRGKRRAPPAASPGTLAPSPQPTPAAHAATPASVGAAANAPAANAPAVTTSVSTTTPARVNGANGASSVANGFAASPAV